MRLPVFRFTFVALLTVGCRASVLAQGTPAGDAPCKYLVRKRARVRRQEWRCVAAGERAGQGPDHRAHLDRADRGGPFGHRHRRQRAHPDAGAHRRPLARHAGAADADRRDHGRHGFHQSDGRRRGHRHADARLHHGARPGRPGLGPEAGHRHGHRGGPAHLALGRHDYRDQRARRLPPALRAAAHHRRAAEPHGADQRQPHRRRPRRGARARARATHARGKPDQAHGGRRRVFAAQPAGCVELHRSRTARGGRGGRQLGHLRGRPRLHAAGGAAAPSMPASRSSSTRT